MPEERFIVYWNLDSTITRYEVDDKIIYKQKVICCDDLSCDMWSKTTRRVVSENRGGTPE